MPSRKVAQTRPRLAAGVIAVLVLPDVGVGEGEVAGREVRRSESACGSAAGNRRPPRSECVAANLRQVELEALLPAFRTGIHRRAREPCRRDQCGHARPDDPGQHATAAALVRPCTPEGRRRSACTCACRGAGSAAGTALASTETFRIVVALIAVGPVSGAARVGRFLVPLHQARSRLDRCSPARLRGSCS